MEKVSQKRHVYKSVDEGYVGLYLTSLRKAEAKEMSSA